MDYSIAFSRGRTWRNAACTYASLSYYVLHILIIFSSVYNEKSFLNESYHIGLQPDRQPWCKYLDSGIAFRSCTYSVQAVQCSNYSLPTTYKCHSQVQIWCERMVVQVGLQINFLIACSLSTNFCFTIETRNWFSSRVTATAVGHNDIARMANN